jgi:hypothetical protein
MSVPFRRTHRRHLQCDSQVEAAVTGSADPLFISLAAMAKPDRGVWTFLFTCCLVSWSVGWLVDWSQLLLYLRGAHLVTLQMQAERSSESSEQSLTM